MFQIIISNVDCIILSSSDSSYDSAAEELKNMASVLEHRSRRRKRSTEMRKDKASEEEKKANIEMDLEEYPNYGEEVEEAAEKPKTVR